MRRGDWKRRAVLALGRFLTCCLLILLPAMAEESLLMPLASRSLLLDIQRIDGRLVAVGSRGHVLTSDDGGESWQQSRVPTRQMLTALHFPTDSRGWAVGHDGLILASICGGDTWVVQRDGLEDQRALDRRRLASVLARQNALRDELLLASDRAAREQLQDRLDALDSERDDLEQALEQPVFAPPLLDVFFADPLTGVAVGAFNTLLITEDGGLNWRSAGDRLDNPDEMHLNAVVGDGEGGFWIAAEGGLLFRSLDGAATWERLESPYTASWFGIVRSPRSGVLLAFGLRGNLFRSVDQGNSWDSVATGVERSISGGAFLSDSFAVLVGAVGIMLVSSDGGLTFSSSPLAQRANLSAVAGAQGQIVAVGQGGIHRRSGLGNWL